MTQGQTIEELASEIVNKLHELKIETDEITNLVCLISRYASAREEWRKQKTIKEQVRC